MNTLDHLPMAAADIKTRAWTLVDIGFSDLCEKVIAGYNIFLAEPEEYRTLWTIPSIAKQGPDSGYVPRNGGKHDFKAIFHYRPGLIMALEEQGVDVTGHRIFLTNCHALYTKAYALALRFAELELNPLMPGIDFSQLMREPFAECRHTIRLLSYTDKPHKGKQLAKKHVDRCLITQHLWESASGLELEEPDGKIHHYVQQPGKALFFPGKKARIFSEGLIPEAPHGVVGREDVDCDILRQSIVSFWHIDCVIEEEK